jgi:hypothetical protein
MGVMHNVRQVTQDETQRSVTNVGHTEPISGTRGLYLESMCYRWGSVKTSMFHMSKSSFFSIPL